MLIYFYVVPSQILLSSDTVFAMLQYLVALGTLKCHDINRESDITCGTCECLQ